MNIDVNFQYTVVYDRESVIETIISRLLHRVQIVPSFGVEEFLAINLLSADSKFTYTPEVILFSNGQSDTIAAAFKLKGFPCVRVLEYAELYDSLTLARGDYTIAKYIDVLVAYATQSQHNDITVLQANAFMSVMAGSVFVATKADFVDAVATNIIEQIKLSIGVTGIDRLNQIVLSGGVIRDVQHSDVDAAIINAAGYSVFWDDIEYRVMLISTRTPMYKIVNRMTIIDFTRVILVNYTPMASADGVAYRLSIVNMTPYPTSSLGDMSAMTDYNDVVCEWLFGTLSSTMISYATMTEKNDIKRLLKLE